ncbi:MAG: bifunctional hydroxymethylpyrimidine kinase/phosphomethylpyrimidine kinase [Alphaproteobacteria bacterium]|nr:bifunctional hydroxymethylpyrimidine kinase/phosphomethylpyrimidine kinase [Alphaproteobacteria bacterium]
MKGRVLIIAGSDSGGGAGIQADIKTVTCLGGYAMTAVTALTAQNTEGVHGVLGVDPGFIEQQMAVVLDDIGADCIKIGMLHTAEVMETVAKAIKRLAPDVPVVVDPVMVAKGGARLLDADATDVLKRDIILIAALLTPNIPEAEALTGMSIADRTEMEHAAQMLHTLGPDAVLLKGGHLGGKTVVDLLCDDNGLQAFEDPRVKTRHTHGTGCTLASAIATGLAQGMALPAAVKRARAYLMAAIRSAPGLGRGHGPLDHGHTVKKSAQAG